MAKSTSAVMISPPEMTQRRSFRLREAGLLETELDTARHLRDVSRGLGTNFRFPAGPGKAAKTGLI